MDQLHAEILLSIFKNLDSKDMVRSMRVCQSWFQIINENKSVWRRLALQNCQYGCINSIVRLFDRRSESSLKEVSITFADIGCNTSLEQFSPMNDALARTLERSKNSICYLHLLWHKFCWWNCPFDLSWKLPHLRQCVIDCYFKGTIDIRDRSQEIKENQPRCLKVLWSANADVLLDSHLYLLDNIVSLHVKQPFTSAEWRKFLEKPSSTLKELRIRVSDPQDHQPSLEFLRLKVFEIDCCGSGFPSWIKVPPTSTCICAKAFPFSTFPSVSPSWVQSFLGIERLNRRCPTLAELRWTGEHPGGKSNLLPTLRTRRKDVKRGIEVDGVKMIHLETLVIDFQQFTQRQITQMKATGVQVVDLNTVDNSFQVEV